MVLRYAKGCNKFRLGIPEINSNQGRPKGHIASPSILVVGKQNTQVLQYINHTSLALFFFPSESGIPPTQPAGPSINKQLCASPPLPLYSPWVHPFSQHLSVSSVRPPNTPPYLTRQKPYRLRTGRNHPKRSMPLMHRQYPPSISPSIHHLINNSENNPAVDLPLGTLQSSNRPPNRPAPVPFPQPPKVPQPQRKGKGKKQNPGSMSPNAQPRLPRPPTSPKGHTSNAQPRLPRIPPQAHSAGKGKKRNTSPRSPNSSGRTGRRLRA